MPGHSDRYRKLNDGIVLTTTESTPSSVLEVIGSICMAMSASPVCSIWAWAAAVSACCTVTVEIGAGSFQ